jgi:2-methylcitrate dehydratase PrpD
MGAAAETIAGWTTGLTLDDVPEDVVEAAKLHLLDTLGCGLAAHATGIAGEGRATMAELGGEEQATVIGSARRLPAANAAFANAMLCHGLDFDDTHSDSVSHVSTVIGPAALAAGEQAGAGGRDVLAAVIAGNEVVCRVGMAASGEFHRRGFHPTAVCGIFGGVAAVAKLSGLAPETTTAALGIAGSFASGLFAYLADGTPTKPMHPAWAAHGAHLATRLAHHGAVGPRSVLEGKFGLYHAFVGAEEGSVDIEGQLADLGSRWETPRIAYKPFPVCHFMHGSLGAAAEGAAGRTFTAGEIDDVLVTVPAAGVSLVLEPAEQKRTPRSEYEGKFSLQYSVASQLVRGHVAVGDFTDEAIADPDVLAVAAKVRYETREYPTYPQAFPGGVAVRLADGSTFEADFPHQKGGPENPLSADEVREKYRENAALALPEAAAAALEEAVLALEEQADLAAALAPLQLREVARV